MITSQLQEFFEDYAKTITEMDLIKLKTFFCMPFIVVHKEPESVISFDQELERKIKGFLISLKDKGVHSLHATVSKALEVSSYMTFVNVDWLLKDEEEKVVKNISHSYIVSNTDNKLAIVTLIVDDNSDLFLELLK